MNWLHTATIILHVLLATSIVALVLLQRGRGADAGAGFGAGASGTVFGARGSASFLSRSTATLAGLFIATSLALAYMGGQRPNAPTSVIERVKLPAEQPVPALPPLPSASPAPTNASPGATTSPAVENAAPSAENPGQPAPPAPGSEPAPKQ